MLRIARVDLQRRLNAHRVLSLTVIFLSLIGGGIRILGRSSLRVQRQLRDELALAKTAQEQPLAEQISGNRHQVR